MRMMPINATIGAKFSGLSSEIQPSPCKPDREKIHGVRVVPMFEPMMTPMVCPRVIMPELTRPTSITVMAEEDWMAMVMIMPSAIATKRLEVIFFSERSKEPPASLLRPEDRTFMP